MSGEILKHPALSWRDYLELCKPNVVALMLVTSVIGMFMASPGMVPLDILCWGNLGIACCAGSAAAINHLVDFEADAEMRRTQDRPVAQGRISRPQAVLFALLLGLCGMTILLVNINALTAWLTLASLLGYALVYTLFLKRATPQNIVIGGLAGATPPLLGWTAVTNQVDGHGLLLVLIIFAWTPPHFWALAIHRKDEYALVNIPMLPVTHGIAFTKLQVLLYTLILCAASLLPFATGLSSYLYLLGAIVLGLGYVYWAIALLRSDGREFAMDAFKYSIIYLFALFAIMLIDHWLLPAPIVVEMYT
ncbi:MAG: heme o synthase [Pseudomonadales bacterium]